MGSLHQDVGGNVGADMIDLADKYYRPVARVTDYPPEPPPEPEPEPVPPPKPDETELMMTAMMMTMLMMATGSLAEGMRE